jgi:ABC-type transport system substrate-binding protein
MWVVMLMALRGVYRMATKMFDVRLRKTVFVVTIVAALFIGMLAPFMAVLPVAHAAPLGGKYGGNYNIALKAEPGAINPLASPNRETAQIIDLVYESLARRDPATLELKPWVASSWTIDGLNVTVTLKDNVLWHDGSAISVDDVAYTYKVSGYAPDSVANITKNATAGTVTFALSRPDGTFLIDGLLLKLVHDGFTAASAPMGCGPFKYDSKVANVSLTLRAFEEHFNGRPYLDTIKYTYYTDFETAAKDLMNTTVNFLGWNIDVSQASQNVNFSGQSTNLMIFNNTTIERSFGTEFLYLGFNCMPSNPLTDLPLRMAIANCIDKTSISALDVSGSAKASDSIVSPRNTPWYNTSITKYPFDLSVANNVLDKAGYFDINADGWREKPNGSALALRLLLPTIDESLTLVTIGDQILETSIENVGINLTLNNQLTANMSGIINSNNFDMYLGFETRGEVSPLFMKSLFYSTNIATGTNYMNFNGTTREINGTVSVDAVSAKGTLARCNLVPTGEMTAYKNGVLWGKASNQTLPVINNTANLKNVSINNGFSIYKNWVKMTTGYTLNQVTGIVTFSNGTITTSDVVNASYTYVTYNNVDHKKGTISIVKNFNYSTDKLTMSLIYRGVDDAMDKIANSLNEANITKYVKEAQGFLSNQVPYAPITSYMVLNAYNKGQYIGWTTMLGGLNNYWSMTNMQNNLYEGSTLKSLTVSASAYPGYVESAGTLPVDITVTDSKSTPVSGVTVVLTVGTGTLSAVTDNDDGTYSATYTAPNIASTVSTTISAKAALSGYVTGYVNTSITIHTVTRLFTIEVTPVDSSMKSGNETVVAILVTDDETGLAVSGADVMVTVEPAGAGGWIVDGIGTTDAGGGFEVTLKTQNVSVDTTFRIVASVSKISYQQDAGTANVAVSKYGGEKPNKGLLGLPGLGAFASLAAIGTAAILIGAIRKRRKQ